MTAPSNPNAMPEYAVLPELPLTAEDAQSLRTQIWSTLVKGDDDVEGFLDWAGDDFDLSDDQLSAAFTALRRARLRQQCVIGDYRSRTAAAFAELNANGIVARADFSCCGTCADAEIGDERDDSRYWSGYVYFHTQDTDNLIEDGSTYIGFGAFAPQDLDWDIYRALPDEEKAARYAAQVTGMLDEVVFPIVRRHGIEPQWNRDLGTRILLTDADWYAPLSGD